MKEKRSNFTETKNERKKREIERGFNEKFYILEKRKKEKKRKSLKEKYFVIWKRKGERIKNEKILYSREEKNESV